MKRAEIPWIFIISLSSTPVFALSFLNHHNFDITPINGPKAEETPLKVAARSVPNLSFSSLPKSSDPIDEEENFWINSRQEQKRHYESVKLGQSPKNPERGFNSIDNMNKNQAAVVNAHLNDNFESLSTWFGFPRSFSRTVPKLGKPTERSTIVNSKNFEPESKSQERQEKITVSRISLPDSKPGINIKIQQSSAPGKSTNLKKTAVAEKSSNTEKIPSSKSDLDISDFLILDELSEKLDDSSEERGKEEPEKHIIAPPFVPVQPQRGYFVPPKKIKMFSPIYTSSFDIMRTPYQKGGFSINNLGQKHGQIHNFDSNGNKGKDVDFEENEIKLKKHLSFGDKSPILVFNNLKKFPIQFSSQSHGNHFKSKGSVDVHNNFPALNDLPESSFTMTEISVSPSQGHIEDIGTFLESLKLRDLDGNPKMLKLNFKTVKPLFKKDTLRRKIESSSQNQNNLDQDLKQINGLNTISLKGNMIIDVLQESASNQVSKEREEAKNKKDFSKFSKHDFKKFYKRNMDKYPKMYQFLEKFSDKMVETALRYEIATRYANKSDSIHRLEI